MSRKFYARIHPDVTPNIVDYRTSSLTFKASPHDQPWLGWQEITPEQAAHLRKIQINPANPTNSPRVFQVETEETYVEIVKEGRKTASKALDPVATAQIAELQNRLDEVKGIPLQMAAKDQEIASLRAEQAQMQGHLAQILALLRAQGGAGEASASVVAPMPIVSQEAPSAPVSAPAIEDPKPSPPPIVPATPRPGRKREEPKVEVVAPPPVKSDVKSDE